MVIRVDSGLRLFLSVQLNQLNRSVIIVIIKVVNRYFNQQQPQHDQKCHFCHYFHFISCYGQIDLLLFAQIRQLQCSPLLINVLLVYFPEFFIQLKQYFRYFHVFIIMGNCHLTLLTSFLCIRFLLMVFIMFYPVGLFIIVQSQFLRVFIVNLWWLTTLQRERVRLRFVNVILAVDSLIQFHFYSNRQVKVLEVPHPALILTIWVQFIIAQCGHHSHSHFSSHSDFLQDFMCHFIENCQVAQFFVTKIIQDGLLFLLIDVQSIFLFNFLLIFQPVVTNFKGFIFIAIHECQCLCCLLTHLLLND